MLNPKPMLAIVFAPALGLAACAPEAEQDVTYEVGVEDVGGGELQVADPQPGDVEVNLPETPMINVPDDQSSEAGDDTEVGE